MFYKYLKSSFLATFLLFVLFTGHISAQNVSEEINSIHGNFQLDAQYYNADSLIGAPTVPEKMLSNAWGNINYIKGKFSAGVRYEAYNNVMQGFDPRYRGQGITNRFARYQDNLLDITVGHIYEQFGSGLLFRTYFEPGLLYDNALDGIRVISNPVKGVTLKGLTGRQRSFFALGPGIVRGADAEVFVNDLFDSIGQEIKTKVILGGSFVSKYQADENPDFFLPENVGAYGGRINLVHEGFSFFGEYVVKENDPGADNVVSSPLGTLYSYKKGEAMFLSTSIAMKGMSFLLQAKRIDNMAFRSDRDANLQNLLINYLPATTRQHTYLMPAFNPYATQPRGEVGGMAELQYRFKKGSLMGGKYGTDITLNYSAANGLKEIGVDDTLTAVTLYKTSYLDVGQIYYQDMFIEITKKITQKWKLTLMLAQQFYNKNIVQFGSKNAGYDNIKSNIGVFDLTYKYKSNSAIRLESQIYLSENKSNPNAGSWTTNMVEWTPNTHFFIALLDQYNFSNPDEDRITSIVRDNGISQFLNDAGLNKLSSALNLHYFLLSAGYTSGPHRISLSVGKQRAGIFCVGGVCRVVPASNGVALSITSSF
jgi:hypothetical protein